MEFLLRADEIERVERERAGGITSGEVVRLFEARGAKLSASTFRKYVQLGLLPRSRRVGRKGKHTGSTGLYPVDGGAPHRAHQADDGRGLHGRGHPRELRDGAEPARGRGAGASRRWSPTWRARRGSTRSGGRSRRSWCGPSARSRRRYGASRGWEGGRDRPGEGGRGTGELGGGAGAALREAWAALGRAGRGRRRDERGKAQRAARSIRETWRSVRTASAGAGARRPCRARRWPASCGGSGALGRRRPRDAGGHPGESRPTGRAPGPTASTARARACSSPASTTSTWT